ncbi:P2X purinoceptor 6 isoform X2 [Phasianus colchicus]|uniref:P2X purinoceptor 6 isoform X2 n=1 Tax=Phasianus colchicus TaxID=9054 RepID=UPI00129D563C|nr:P2X purinoceptor 6 isoform X2 [Phasianus colchicus]
MPQARHAARYEPCFRCEGEKRNAELRSSAISGPRAVAMATSGGGGAALCGELLDYKTEKFALTRNRRVGLLHRLLQLAVLGYVLGWVFVVRRGYQDTDAAPHVSVVTKLKGVSVSRAEDARRRLWDAADFSRPPQGENVLFLVTNFIVTDKQVQGTCPEKAGFASWLQCMAVQLLKNQQLFLIKMKSKDILCPEPLCAGWDLHGRCGLSCWEPSGSRQCTHSTCEIFGWCPVENDTLPRRPLLAEAENFTLFIKNTVNFTKFNFSKGNTLQTNDPTYFKTCMYDPFFSPSCPVFRIRDMVEAAGETFGSLALLGGSISVRIEWDCDLDQPAAHCQPRYSFILLDRRYNFRTASYYWDSQRQHYRSLLKLYGIRFDISVHGQAGKFGIIPAAVSFGTGIALFGTATMVCDLVLLYLDAKADFYWKEKFEEAKPPKGKKEATAEAERAGQDLGDAQQCTLE